MTVIVDRILVADFSNSTHRDISSKEKQALPRHLRNQIKSRLDLMEHTLSDFARQIIESDKDGEIRAYFYHRKVFELRDNDAGPNQVGIWDVNTVKQCCRKIIPTLDKYCTTATTAAVREAFNAFIELMNKDPSRIVKIDILTDGMANEPEELKEEIIKISKYVQTHPVLKGHLRIGFWQIGDDDGASDLLQLLDDLAEETHGFKKAWDITDTDKFYKVIDKETGLINPKKFALLSKKQMND